MRAIYADKPSSVDPLSALCIGEQPEPAESDTDRVTVTVQAAALNHHDLWTLRGAGMSVDRYPVILGSEASGIAEDGAEVVAGAMIVEPRWSHDPVRDPARTLLGEDLPGTFAERVSVPRHALAPKPAWLSHEEAACLSGTWLTAYRMLFTKSGLRPGETMLVQGAGGGVSTALIRLGRAAGFRVWVTGRDASKRAKAEAIGAHATFAVGRPLPEPVDAVMESVGRATWSHSLRSLRPGGSIVVTGATTGADANAHLNRIFWSELRIIGSTSGTLEEFQRLCHFMHHHNLRPDIAEVLPFTDARQGFERLLASDVFGKTVFTWQ